jgi:hypothetical protein
MLTDAQTFNASHEMRMAEQERKGEMQKFEMEQQMAEEQRKAKGRQFLADSLEEISIDPYGSRISRLGEIESELPQRKTDLKNANADRQGRDPKAALTISSNISMLESEQRKLAAEIDNPILMAKEYDAQATQAQTLAVESASIDPKLVGIYQNLSNTKIQQSARMTAIAQQRQANKHHSAKMKLEEKKLLKAGKQVNRQLREAILVDKDGELVNSVMIGVDPNTSGHQPGDVNKKWKDYKWSASAGKGLGKKASKETNQLPIVKMITNQLSKRFGTMDSTGSIIITPGLEDEHVFAQKIAEKTISFYQEQGIPISNPLIIINNAQQQAETVVPDFVQGSIVGILSNNNIKDKKAAIKSQIKAFYNLYGFQPDVRRIEQEIGDEAMAKQFIRAIR